MDDVQRAAWRKRLERAYGNWLCPICKTALASQQQFEWRQGLELTRHSECGHVIFFRTIAVIKVREYVGDRWDVFTKAWMLAHPIATQQHQPPRTGRQPPKSA